MAAIKITLLGALGVEVDGQCVDLPPSRKTRALLVLLAMEPGPHDRALLCDRLWPDTADPRAALRWSLTKLRGVLGADALLASGAAVQLDFTVVSTDLAVARAVVEQAEVVALDDLRDLEARFAPTPLADLQSQASAEFELWLESQRQGLARLHQKVLGRLIARLTPQDALEMARKRVTLDPLNESANIGLLEATRAVLGRQEGQAALERMRARMRDAGLPDDALLAAWRRISDASSASTPVAPGEPSQSESADHLPAPPGEPGTLTLPSKPSVAVLGFESLGERGDVLAEGLTVDVSFKLARLHELFVIARASTRRFSLAYQDGGSIGRMLGVRYLIHGDAQRSGNRIRVTAGLIETERGAEIWSERFERPFDDVFDVQDQFADAIISALVPRIELAEQERVRFLPTADLGAWECFHRAMWHSFRFTAADIDEADALLLRAIALDPQFARAHAGLSFSLFSRVFLDSSKDREGDLARAVDLARTSVSLQPRDSMGHWSLGRALLLSGEHDQALASIDRALIANPNYAQGHYARGFVEAHSNLGDAAVQDLDMAHRLSPFDPMVFAMMSCRAISLAVTGRHAESADWAQRATREGNAHFHIHAIAAACLQLAGRQHDAEACVAQTLELHPGYNVAVFQRSLPHKSAADQRLIGEALRAAGMAP